MQRGDLLHIGSGRPPAHGIAAGPPPLDVAVHALVAIQHQRHLHLRGAGQRGEPVGELGTGEQLRHDDVVPGREMDPGRGDGQLAGG